MPFVYRNSLFGFDKSDVVRFISKQSSMHETKVAELNAEIENTRKHYEAELEELRQDSAALSAMKEEHLRKIDAILQLRNVAEDLKEDRLLILSLSEQNKATAQQMGKDISDLKSALRTAEGYREKAAKFDQLSSVLNGIVNGGEAVVPKAEVGAPEVNIGNYDFVDASFEKQLQSIYTLAEKLDRALELLECISQ